MNEPYRPFYTEQLQNNFDNGYSIPPPPTAFQLPPIAHQPMFTNSLNHSLGSNTGNYHQNYQQQQPQVQQHPQTHQQPQSHNQQPSSLPASAHQYSTNSYYPHMPFPENGMVLETTSMPSESQGSMLLAGGPSTSSSPISYNGGFPTNFNNEVDYSSLNKSGLLPKPNGIPRVNRPKLIRSQQQVGIHIAIRDDINLTSDVKDRNSSGFHRKLNKKTVLQKKMSSMLEASEQDMFADMKSRTPQKFVEITLVKMYQDISIGTASWSSEETRSQRRLLQVEWSVVGSTLFFKFNQVFLHNYNPNILTISVIYWNYNGQYYITSYDLINLVCSICRIKPDQDEKNRIRRNLQLESSVTIGKIDPLNKTSLEKNSKRNYSKFSKQLNPQYINELFDIISNYDNPKPRNICKDIKIYPWVKIESLVGTILTQFCYDL